MFETIVCMSCLETVFGHQSEAASMRFWHLSESAISFGSKFTENIESSLRHNTTVSYLI